MDGREERKTAVIVVSQIRAAFAAVRVFTERSLSQLFGLALHDRPASLNYSMERSELVTSITYIEVCRYGDTVV